jgi:hypothetical protein
VADKTAEQAEVEAELAPMLEGGWIHFDHEHFKPGVRVRNWGEQYDTARQFGTAVVEAVMRKEGSWEKTYGRLNLEVLVRRDRPDLGNELMWWQDYRTALTEGCWLCDGAGCDRCAEHRTSPGLEVRDA